MAAVSTASPPRRRRALRAAPLAVPARGGLGLPPVELQAPTGAVRRPTSLALRAAISVSLLLGVFLLAFVLVVGLVVVNVVLWRDGEVIPALVVACIVTVLAVGKALVALVKRPPAGALEIELPERDDPALWQEVRRIAAEVGTRPPDRVVVVAEVNAYVHERAPLFGLLRGTRTLAIGTPLLDLLTASQLRAVLAHELGHFAGGDTRLGPIAYRTENTLSTVVSSLGRNITAIAFICYARMAHRVSASVRRAQEVTADRASVAIAGRQAAADALRAIDVGAHAYDAYRQGYVLPLLRRGHVPVDLTGGFRQYLAARHDSLVAYADRCDDLPRALDRYASHPPIPERIRRVESLPETTAGAQDDRPAAAMFVDPHRWCEAAEARRTQLSVKGTKLVSVTWDAFGAVVTQPQAEAAATAVDRALGELGHPTDVRGLREAFEAGEAPALAAKLVAQGWAGDERLLLHSTVQAMAIRELMAHHGVEWRTSWSGPVELVDAKGAEVDLDGLVTRALDGDWKPLTKAVAVS